MTYQVSESDIGQSGIRIGYSISKPGSMVCKWWMGSRANALKEAARMDAKELSK